MQNITHLGSIDISATDPAGLVDFYEATWGVQQVDGEASTVALRARGTEHHVLSLVKGTGHSLKRLSAAAADADEVADRVLRHGVEPCSPSYFRCRSGC